MKTIRRFTAALLALLLITPGLGAQGWPAQRVQTTLSLRYDVPAAGYTYVVFGDRNAAVTMVPVNGVFGPGTAVNFKAKTVGSSTTVTSNTAGQKPFQGLAVGDLLIFPQTVQNVPPTLQAGDIEVTITTWTDAENIVVSNAVDLTGGFTFRFKKALSSTSADQAYFDVGGFDNFTVQFDVDQINATSLDAILECRVSKYARSFSDTTWTKNFTAAGSYQIHVTSRQEQCRVGWKFNTDTGVQRTSVYFTGAK